MKTQRMWPLLATAILTAALISLPASPSNAEWGCSVGTYDSHQFYSLCNSNANIRQHRARARIYFNSGYGSTVHSNWRDIGVESVSAYYSTGVVSDGPWLETWR